MTEARYLDRLSAARSARLATANADGTPHLVPIVFAYDDGHIYSAIDQKPKSTVNLKRLRNIRENPHVSVLVDHYSDDWDQLWWVRADGTARVLEAGASHERAIDLLVEKYDQYQDRRPKGPVVDVEVDRVLGWAAS